MKLPKMILGLFILITLTALSGFAQEITLTTTKANLVASRAVIDSPGLAGSPYAIIVATPLGETETLNPHTVGAWYYNEKWHIFNTDHAVLGPGSKFKVQIFLKRDANHFLHLVTKDNLVGDSSYIDSPALNNNPNAQVQIFLNHAPDIRSAALNKYKAQAVYDPTAGKWSIKNVNGEQLSANAAYNIVVSSGGGTVVTNPTLPTTTPYVPVVPMTIANAPLTVVARAEFVVPEFNILLSPGYCKAPVATYTNPSILITDTVIVTGQYADGLAQLRWSAMVSGGSVMLTLCNNSNSAFGSSTPLNYSYRKVNILVLR